MLRRSGDLAFGAGVHVFPGGAVDQSDRSPLLDAYCCGRTDQEASELLGIRSGGLAFYVAAIRECFEEAGLLLIRPMFPPSSKVPPSSNVGAMRAETLSLWDPVETEDRQRFRAHRSMLIAGKIDLAHVCRSENMALAVGDLRYAGRWITPAHSPRRFDTRFFVAVYSGNQEVSCDGHEVVSAEWLEPADALASREAGDITMMPPTIANLMVLARSKSAPEAVARISAPVEVDGNGGGRRD